MHLTSSSFSVFHPHPFPERAQDIKSFFSQFHEWDPTFCSSGGLTAPLNSNFRSMKTIAACPDCIHEASKDGRQPKFNPIAGELDDNGMIHVTCDRGHHGVVLYNARRYEVLVKSAARAALDGYTNEVVAVMSTALERMYEFYIRVSSRARGIPEGTVEVAWKNVAAQSERQFGAFQFLYMLDQSRPFKLESRITETRNKVVHRGKIVREAEALEFAENVYGVIQHLQAELQSKFAQFVAE